MKKYFSITDNVSVEDMFLLHPKLLMVLAALNNFCYLKGIPFKITSMVRPHDTISKSTTHQTARAFDVRTKSLTEYQVAKMVEFLEDYDAFYNVGAISKRNGMSRLVYNEPHGTGPHLHCQVRP